MYGMEEVSINCSIVQVSKESQVWLSGFCAHFWDICAGCERMPHVAYLYVQKKPYVRKNTGTHCALNPSFSVKCGAGPLFSGREVEIS